MIKVNLTFKIIVYILALIIFFILSNLISSNRLYYVESSTWNLDIKTNSSYSYKNYCSKWSSTWVCDFIDNDFFYSSYYWECAAIRDNDISKCDLLTLDEHVDFCKNNFIIYSSIKSWDILKCDSLDHTNTWTYDKDWNAIKTDWYNEIWHNKKDNKSFCKIATKLSKSRNLNDIDSFILEYFWEDRFWPRVFWVVLQDSNYCYKIDWIDDKIKCLIYTNSLKCNNLSDKEYIYELIDNTNHFYDLWKDGL